MTDSLPPKCPSLMSPDEVMEATGFVSRTLHGDPKLCALADKTLPIIAERLPCFAVAVMAEAIAWDRGRFDSFDVEDFVDIHREAWTEILRDRTFRLGVAGWAKSTRILEFGSGRLHGMVSCAFLVMDLAHPMDRPPVASLAYLRSVWKFVTMHGDGDRKPIECALWMPASAGLPRPTFRMPEGVPHALQSGFRPLASGWLVRAANSEIARQRRAARID